MLLSVERFLADSGSSLEHGYLASQDPAFCKEWIKHDQSMGSIVKPRLFGFLNLRLESNRVTCDRIIQSKRYDWSCQSQAEAHIFVPKKPPLYHPLDPWTQYLWEALVIFSHVIVKLILHGSVLWAFLRLCRCLALMAQQHNALVLGWPRDSYSVHDVPTPKIIKTYFFQCKMFAVLRNVCVCVEIQVCPAF